MYIIGVEQGGLYEDGSRYDNSARKIFGVHYDEWVKNMSNNETLRENKRTEMIGDYVKAKGLSVKMYQDYGWVAKPIFR